MRINGTISSVVLLATISILLVASCNSGSPIESSGRISTDSNRQALIKDMETIDSLCLLNKNYAKGDSLYAIRQLPEAMSYFDVATSDFKKANAEKQLIQTLNRLAWGNAILGQNEAVLRELEVADSIARKVLSEFHPLRSRLHTTYGRFYDMQYDYQKSFRYYRRSLSLVEDVYGSYSFEAARLYFLLGEYYKWSVLDNYTAIDYYEKALEFFEETTNSFEQYRIPCLYSIASSYRSIDDLDKAIIYARKLVSISYLDDQGLRRYLEYGNSLLATIQYDKHKYIQAVKYYKESIALNKSMLGHENIHLGDYYTNLGATYYQLDSLDQAISCCNHAILIYEIIGEKSLNLSDAYKYLFFTYQKAGYDILAKKNMFLMLNILEIIVGENHKSISEAFYDVGKYYMSRNQIDSAIIYTKKSIEAGCKEFNFTDDFTTPGTQAIGNNYFSIVPIAQLAKLLEIKYKNTKDEFVLNKILDLYLICDTLIDKSKNNLEFQESKLLYAGKYKNLYQDAINISFALYEKNPNDDYFNQIYYFIEKNRARLLTDNFEKKAINISYHSEINRINYLIQHTQRLISEQNNNDKLQDSDSLNSVLYDLIRQNENLKKEISKKYPVYHQLTSSENFPEIKELTRRYPQSSFIQFFWGDSILFSTCFTNNYRTTNKTLITNGLTDSLKSYVATLTCTDTGKMDPQEYADYAHFLYEKLFLNLFKRDSTLYESERIVIIPDGLLNYLPFESLVYEISESKPPDFSSLKYLIRVANISYSFSLNFLMLNSSAKRPADYRDVLGFAYTSQESTKHESDKNIKIVSLPGSEEELKNIQQIFSGQYFFGNDASETNFRKNISKGDILHLAVHGSFDESNNNSTYLLFNTNNDTDNDGIVYNYDLYPYEIKYNLVVLSACETALGHNAEGEGLLSIGWSFAYAGSANLITSLWKTSDISTLKLMNNFYSNVSSGEDIGRSLKEAKISYLKNSDSYTAHPKYWASFILYGIPGANKKSMSTWTYFLILLLAAFVLTLYFQGKIKNNTKT